MKVFVPGRLGFEGGRGYWMRLGMTGLRIRNERNRARVMGSSNLGALVGHLDDLMVSLLERLRTQLVPIVLCVEGVGSLQGDVNVAALDRQVEAGLLVGDEVKRHLRKAFFLQIGDDGVAAQLGLLDDTHDAFKLALVQAKLEHALGRVHHQLAHLRESSETEPERTS